jgi:hypothetical protein
MSIVLELRGKNCTMVLFVHSNSIASHFYLVLFVMCILGNSFYSKQVFFQFASL